MKCSERRLTFSGHSVNINYCFNFGNLARFGPLEPIVCCRRGTCVHYFEQGYVTRTFFFLSVILPTACEININIPISQSRKFGGSRKVKLSVQAQKYIYTKADVCSALQTGNPSLPERWLSPALGQSRFVTSSSPSWAFFSLAIFFSFCCYSFFQPKEPDGYFLFVLSPSFNGVSIRADDGTLPKGAREPESGSEGVTCDPGAW